MPNNNQHDKLNAQQILKLISTEDKSIKLEPRKLGAKENDFLFNVFISKRAVSFCYCKKCKEVIHHGGSVTRHACCSKFLVSDRLNAEKRKPDEAGGPESKKPSIASHFTQPATSSEKSTLSSMLGKLALETGVSFRSLSSDAFKNFTTDVIAFG